MRPRVLGARFALASALAVLPQVGSAQSAQPTRGGGPAELAIRVAGENSVRVTLKPLSFPDELPYTPTLAVGRTYPDPVIALREISSPVRRRVGNLDVTVRPEPLSVEVRTAAARPVQTLVFADDGSVSFDVGSQPILGMGEGGPEPGEDWRTGHQVEFDRRGRLHEMRPR